MSLRRLLATTITAAVAVSPAYAQEPVCPTYREPPSQELPFDLLEESYSMRGHALLRLVDLEGRIGGSATDFTVTWPGGKRHVSGKITPEGLDFDWEGHQNPVKYKGWFNGSEGYLCEYEQVEDAWRLNEVIPVRIERVKEKRERYKVRVDFEGKPFDLILKLEK